jgi:hypothetical protein
MTKALAMLLLGVSLVALQAQVAPGISRSPRGPTTEADIQRLQNEINALDRMPNATQEQRQARQRELFLRLKELEDNHRREKEILESVKLEGTLVRKLPIDPASGIDLTVRPPFWDGFTLPNRLALYTAEDLNLDKKTEEALRRVARSLAPDKFPAARRELKAILAEHREEHSEPLIHYVVRVKYIEPYSDLKALAEEVDDARGSNNRPVLNQKQKEFNKLLDSKPDLTVAIQKTLYFLIEVSKESIP